MAIITMRFQLSDATVAVPVLELLTAALSIFPAAGFVQPTQRSHPCSTSQVVPPSTSLSRGGKYEHGTARASPSSRRSVTLSHHNTNDYLSSLSFLASDAPNDGQSATTDAYLNSLSAATEYISSGPLHYSPEEYLSSLSSSFVVADAAESATSGYGVASGIVNTAVNSSPPGVLDAAGVTDAASDSASTGPSIDLSSQLSELSQSYGAMVDDKFRYVEKAGAPGSKSPFTSLSMPQLDGSDSGNIAAGVSSRFAAAADGSREALGALFGRAGSSLSSALEQAGTSLRNVPGAIQDGTSNFVESTRATIYGRANQGFAGMEAGRSKLVDGVAEGGANTVRRLSDASISDLANGVLSGLKTVGGVVMRIMDTFLDIFAGTSVAEIVHGAQASVLGIVDGAVASVMGIGNITLKDAALALVSLLTMVVKVLFAILSAIVKVASGKGVDEWAMAATGAVEHEASRLMAQASATAVDITHRSFAELGDAVGHFSHDVGRFMVESVDTVAIGSQMVS